MTFSIVARSAFGGAFGVAVAGRHLAIGSIVPAIRSGVGALATQSYGNPPHRAQGMVLLDTGVAATEVVAGLMAADPQRAKRQLGVVGRLGDGATYTGARCTAWAGGMAGPGYAIQGNLLTGPQVIDAMLTSWLAGASPAEDPPAIGRRLVAALRAGDDAGGDRRGRQSAALLVRADTAEPGHGPVDLRVDDHPDPIGELERLLELHVLR